MHVGPLPEELGFTRKVFKLLPALMIYLKIQGVPISVTRLGDLLDFGQLFKAFGNH